MKKGSENLSIQERKIMMEIFTSILCARYSGIEYTQAKKFVGYWANKIKTKEGENKFENAKRAEKY